jgi:quercetin dioxygenase-like cupin family protein
VTGPAVVQALEVTREPTAGGAQIRTLLVPSPRGPQLGRRIVDVPAGSCLEGVGAAGGELWFAVHGAGQLEVEGHPALPVHADRAVQIAPGARYRLSAVTAHLHLDAVALPAAAGTSPPAAPALTVDLAQCPAETTGDRTFRVLFGPARGCPAATQFVGEIPPGRAPAHRHPYDEVVLVLTGDGLLHLGPGEPGYVLTAGTCAHLPPGQPHCLENTGTAMMRVLGVFHPADSPAAKTG